MFILTGSYGVQTKNPEYNNAGLDVEVNGARQLGSCIDNTTVAPFIHQDVQAMHVAPRAAAATIRNMVRTWRLGLHIFLHYIGDYLVSRWI